MADKQKMEITILPSGEVSIKVLCVPGPSCEQVSAALEESLGTVKSKEKIAALRNWCKTRARPASSGWQADGGPEAGRKIEIDAGGKSA